MDRLRIEIVIAADAVVHLTVRGATAERSLAPVGSLVARLGGAHPRRTAAALGAGGAGLRGRPAGPASNRPRSARLRATLNDDELLAEALAAVGFPAVETHRGRQPLYGHPAGGPGAEVVVRRRHTGADSDDVGFARRADGVLEPVVSPRDRARFDRVWLASVAGAYAEAAVRRHAAEHGWRLRADPAGPDGARRIVLFPDG